MSSLNAQITDELTSNGLTWRRPLSLIAGLLSVRLVRLGKAGYSNKEN